MKKGGHENTNITHRFGIRVAVATIEGTKQAMKKKAINIPACPWFAGIRA